MNESWRGLLFPGLLLVRSSAPLRREAVPDLLDRAWALQSCFLSYPTQDRVRQPTFLPFLALCLFTPDTNPLLASLASSLIATSQYKHSLSQPSGQACIGSLSGESMCRPARIYACNRAPVDRCVLLHAY